MSMDEKTIIVSNGGKPYPITDSRRYAQGDCICIINGEKIDIFQNPLNLNLESKTLEFSILSPRHEIDVVNKWKTATIYIHKHCGEGFLPIALVHCRLEYAKTSKHLFKDGLFQEDVDLLRCKFIGLQPSVNKLTKGESDE